MSTWRVFAILFMGLLCLTLASATVVVPMSESAGDHPWLWVAGLAVATAGMGALFALFLKNSERAMK